MLQIILDHGKLRVEQVLDLLAFGDKQSKAYSVCVRLLYAMTPYLTLQLLTQELA